ncbi:MAG: hypothetical protein CEE43_16985 [Promethearchaeota archaeon Loki_b32]|nr:MAG: hypothetical protein CEE43_16985 [Candidatus Lokiarchaeota archaeon Loki_b32]
MELKDIDISKSYSTKSTQKYIIKDSNDCFFEVKGSCYHIKAEDEKCLGLNVCCIKMRFR